MDTLQRIWRFIARKEILVTVLISALAGFILRDGGQREYIEGDGHDHEMIEENIAEVWTCFDAPANTASPARGSARSAAWT